MFADEWGGTIHLNHGEPSAGGRNGVAFSGVGFLSEPQCVQLRLEHRPIDDLGRPKFIFHRMLVRNRLVRGMSASINRHEDWITDTWIGPRVRNTASETSSPCRLTFRSTAE